MSKQKTKINGEIRLKGEFFRIFMPTAGTNYFKFANKTLTLLFKGKRPKNKNFSYNEVYLGKNKNIRTCIYTRKNSLSKNRPVILWIHGGGYGMGIPEYEISFIQEFLNCEDCVVVSPDYTLSIKEKYPKALNECYEVLSWINSNASELNVNKNCICVGGDSAGGGLTVALCLYARDKNEIKIALQMPIYPMIEDRATSTNENNNAPLWNSESNNKAWKIYLGEDYRSENLSYYAAPGRCSDFSNIPPAITYIGDLDLFLDETKTFVKKMNECGSGAKIKVLEGCYHGFDVVAPKSKVAISAREFLRTEFLNVIKNYKDK